MQRASKGLKRFLSPLHSLRSTSPPPPSPLPPPAGGVAACGGSSPYLKEDRAGRHPDECQTDEEPIKTGRHQDTPSKSHDILRNPYTKPGLFQSPFLIFQSTFSRPPISPPIAFFPVAIRACAADTPGEGLIVAQWGSLCLCTSSWCWCA